MICGIDIGGTKVLGLAIADEPLDPIGHRLAPTIYDSDSLVDTIVSMVSDLEVDTGRTADVVGVGVAGIVDRDGNLRYSPNIPGVVDLPLSGVLSDRLQRPVLVENDAASATWAEHRCGSAVGCDNVIFVGLGTGIGSGFVLDGVLHHGWNGFSGESGHMIIDKTGPTHLTGARGPWELTASGSGLTRLARERAAEGCLESVLELAGTADEIHGRHIHAALDADARDVLELLDEFGHEVGIGLANLIHLLDPEVVVIGGGLVDLGDPLLDAIRRQTSSFVLGGDHRPAVSIRPARLGNRSGAIGAALLASELQIG